MAEILAPHIFNEPSLEFSSAGTHGLHDYAISWEVERLLQQPYQPDDRRRVPFKTVDRRHRRGGGLNSCKQARTQSRTLHSAQRPAL